MIKKTLYFETHAYLSLKNKQLVIKFPEIEKNDTLPDSFKTENIKTIPIEDKQFGSMELFYCKKEKEIAAPCQQLELF